MYVLTVYTKLNYLSWFLMQTTWCRWIRKPNSSAINRLWWFLLHADKNMVKYRPDVHCPHIGPSGGDMCSEVTLLFWVDHDSDNSHNRWWTVARNYIDIVETFPFRSTLVAANASYSASDMNGLSEESIDQLLGISTQVVVPTTIAFVSGFYSFFKVVK